MKDIYKAIYDKLHRIYEKHRRRYKRNPDSKQICCMWSTSNPPDTIDATAPFRDIEAAFNISIDEDDCLEIYDMDMEEATIKIADIMKKQC